MSYALAYSGLADCYGLLSFDSAPPVKNMPKARAMALKALELDDQLAEAHTLLAMLKALYDWDWPQAEAAFRRTIALNPGHATAQAGPAVAHHQYKRRPSGSLPTRLPGCYSDLRSRQIARIGIIMVISMEGAKP